MYALAASAAGVGMLAMSRPAEAKIVYTPAHVVIGRNQTYGIHLQHNKVTDFKIFNDCGTISGHHDALLLVDAISATTNAVIGTRTITSAVSAFRLPAGYLVGPKRHWYAGGGGMAAYYRGRFYGQWQNGWYKAVRGYLGLMFKSKGSIHYGWARLTVDATYPCFEATLTGYAYETIPGRSIKAGQTKGPDDVVERPDAALTTPTPEPATLGMLALGERGLSIWRREESVGATQ
jgi:hypothetical protein